MQATITYLISAEAQRAQMAATGKPVARRQTTTEDVPAEWLTSHYCKISADGDVTFDLGVSVQINEQGELSRGSNWTHIGPELDAQPASGLEALQTLTDAITAEMVKQAAAYAVRQTEMAKLLAQRKAEDAERNTRYAEEKRLKAIADDAAKAEEAERERAKSAAIDAFIAASGDDLLIAQHAERMVCRNEIISRMAESVLAFLGPECLDSVVCEDSGCKCQDIVVKCLPNRIYAGWKSISLPEGASAEFRKVRNCLKTAAEDCGDERFMEDTAGPVEYHAIVTVPHGPFQFVRRIQLHRLEER